MSSQCRAWEESRGVGRCRDRREDWLSVGRVECYDEVMRAIIPLQRGQGMGDGKWNSVTY